MDNKLIELRKIMLTPDILDSALPIPRSIEIMNGKMLLGTLGSEIFELDFENENYVVGNFKASKIMSSHYSTSSTEVNEIRCIVYMKNIDMFASVGEDATLRLYDPKSNAMSYIMKLDYDEMGNKIKNLKPTSLDFNSKESEFVVGFNDGSFKLYSGKYKILKSIKSRNEAITHIRYSPDCNYLAVVTRDNMIEVFNTGNWVKFGTLKGHNQFITHIDWCTNSEYIASNSGDGEILYFSKDGKIVPDLKNVEWATWTRALGSDIKGAWAKDVAVLVEKTKNQVAVTDDKGGLRLYKYI
jgi:WD40 repeat protein